MIQYECTRCGLNMTLCQCDLSDPPPVAPPAGERLREEGTRPALSEIIQKPSDREQRLEDALKQVRANLAEYEEDMQFGDEYWQAEDDIAIIDAALGKILPKPSDLNRQCEPFWRGDGWRPQGEPATCPRCGGKGWYTDPRVGMSVAFNCGWNGQTEPCPGK